MEGPNSILAITGRGIRAIDDPHFSDANRALKEAVITMLKRVPLTLVWLVTGLFGTVAMFLAGALIIGAQVRIASGGMVVSPNATEDAGMGGEARGRRGLG
jgi:hypothetical protein